MSEREDPGESTIGETTPARQLAGNANFLLLLGGQFISQMGDRLAMIAFPYLVYNTTHSALSTGVVLALFTLPYVLFGALAGGVLDRLDRRGVMVAADIVRGGLVLAVPILSPCTPRPACSRSRFSASFATVFFDPGMMALLPEIVPDDSLLRANSILEASSHLTEIVGFAAAGVVVYLYFAMKTTFTVDAATFGVSAVTLLAMTLKGSQKGGRQRRHRRRAPGTASSSGKRSARAPRTCSTTPGCGPTPSSPLRQWRASEPFYPLTFFLAVDRFHGARTFGFIEATIAVGYLRRVRRDGRYGKARAQGSGHDGRADGHGRLLHGAVGRPLPAARPRRLRRARRRQRGGAHASIDTYVQSVVPKALRGRVRGARFTLTQGVYLPWACWRPARLRPRWDWDLSSGCAV